MSFVFRPLPLFNIFFYFSQKNVFRGRGIRTENTFLKNSTWILARLSRKLFLSLLNFALAAFPLPVAEHIGTPGSASASRQSIAGGKGRTAGAAAASIAVSDEEHGQRAGHWWCHLRMPYSPPSSPSWPSSLLLPSVSNCVPSRKKKHQ